MARNFLTLGSVSEAGKQATGNAVHKYGTLELCGNAGIPVIFGEAAAYPLDDPHAFVHPPPHR